MPDRYCFPKRFLKLRFVPLAALLFLSACFSGPSESDIKSAFQEASDRVMGKGKVIVEGISGVSCKDAQGKPGYVCSFTATVTNNIFKNHGPQTTEARFVHAESGWVAMNDL